jgi:hypothetical protein
MCNMRAIPILEPGMGNIIPLSALVADPPVDDKQAISNCRDTQCVHGICYLVTKHEFDDIYQSEGGRCMHGMCSMRTWIVFGGSYVLKLLLLFYTHILCTVKLLSV